MDWEVCTMQGRKIGTYYQPPGQPVPNTIEATGLSGGTFLFNVLSKDEAAKKLFGKVARR